MRLMTYLTTSISDDGSNCRIGGLLSAENVRGKESYFARTEAPVVTGYQHSCQCISDSD